VVIFAGSLSLSLQELGVEPVKGQRVGD